MHARAHVHTHLEEQVVVGDAEHVPGVQVLDVAHEVGVGALLLGVQILQLQLRGGGARVLQGEQLLQLLLAEVAERVLVVARRLADQGVLEDL